MNPRVPEDPAGRIAVVGLACRFPGARGVEEFWANLKAGRDSIARFSIEELLAAGIPEEVAWDPSYVPAVGALDDVESFDAALFGVGSAEAERMDPQHRLFLESAWEALEDAGYPPLAGGAPIGVYAGASQSTYLLHVLKDRLDSTGGHYNLAHLLGNDKDYLAPQVAYRLDLTGPAVTVQTACSTSLVAVHAACQALLAGECDLALAGGVTVRVPHRAGYMHQGAGMLAPDGVCRPFDAAASGTVPGSGAGVAVLKRLEDALADGDSIRAVVLGTAVNNDGADKIGFTAPRAEGQARAIRTALAVAGVEPDSIGYVEAHGTGTPLGDPIEVEALARAFGTRTSRRQFCALGAVKSNLGHLECAAGIAGFLKAVLALERELIPGTVHFTGPNRAIELAGSPFFVSSRSLPWRRGADPRRAGVSSFGFGGTNAHAVLEEAPPCAPRPERHPGGPALVVLSAATDAALERLARRYVERLAAGPAIPLEEIEFTAARGRAHLARRLAVVCGSSAELQEALAAFSAGLPCPGLFREGAGPPAGKDATATSLDALAARYVRGEEIDWKGLFPSGRRVALPTYPFERTRHWASPARPPASGGRLHPLLGRRMPAAGPEVVHEREFSAADPAYLADHRYRGRPLFPGAAYVEAFRAAAATALGGDGAVELQGVAFEEPLYLDGDSTRTCRVVARPGGDGSVAIEFLRREEPGSAPEAAWRRHAVATARRIVEPAPDPVESPRALGDGEPVPVDRFLGELASACGMEYGPAFRGLVELRRGGGEAWGRVLSPGALGGLDGDGFHPAILDACFQVAGLWALGVIRGEGNGPLPSPASQPSPPSGTSPDGPEPVGALFLAGIDRIRFERPIDGPVRVRALRRHRDGCALSADLALLDERGASFAVLQGLRFARAAERTEDRDWIHEVRWRRAELPAPERAALPGRWLVLADDGGVGEALVRGIEAAGGRAALATPGTDLARVLRETGGGLAGIVHLSGLRVGRPADSDPTEADSSFLWASALELARNAPPGLRLAFVTRGACSVDGEETSPAQAPVWGLARVLTRERPDLDLLLVDLDPGPTGRGTPARAGEEAGRLLAELLAPERETEVAWRDGDRLVPRLERTRSAPAASPPAAYRLKASPDGVLAGLALEPMPVPAPGPGEVLVRVLASGLNFRDVLVALGQDLGAPGVLGTECAGEVVGLGEGTTGPGVGDRVVAIAEGALASHVVARAELVAKACANLTVAEAATTAVAFLTARHALEDIAGLGAGERLLVHAGAGGVGLAAIQIALALGAEVHATAGSPEKRAFLESLGVSGVYDSRSLAFAEEVRAATGGRGVDVVLNSLSGEAIPASLGTLAPGGRFVEIGKIGTWEPERVEREFPGAVYGRIALDRMLHDDPGAVGEMLREVLRRIESGVWRPLPVRAFPASRAAAAFSHLQRARHVGRVALIHGTGRDGIRPGSTWLVAGGTGGIGLAAARDLAGRGAGTIVLLSRREPAEEASRVLLEIERTGARIVSRRVDLADGSAVDAVVAGVRAEFGPLRGVVHAAGVLGDAPIESLDAERFSRVLAPKIAGAWNLHRATRHDPLDRFVLCSSASALLGWAGQASYAAANAFLGALALRRAALGLPALAVHWGRWTVGMSARLDPAARKRAVRAGLGEIEPARGLAVLEDLAVRGVCEAAVLPIDWVRFLASSGNRDRRGLLSGLGDSRPGSGAPVARAAPAGLLQGLSSLPGAAREREFLERLEALAARAIGVETVDPTRPLRDLGLDSLVAVELRNVLGRELGRRLPASLLFDHPTVEDLGRHLAGVLGWDVARTRVGSGPEIPEVAREDGEVAATPAAAAAACSEGIAIVGLSCRMPGGGSDPESFWAMLARGTDAIREVPPDRWDAAAHFDPDPDAPGKAYCREGGFLDRIDAFDADFFGISPREACSLDPQQRLLLEVVWEALEDAGLAPDRLAGTDTGVFVGITTHDYAELALHGRRESIDAYSGTGTGASVAAGRISYVLGLQGPSMAIDTACSASLVAVHLAARSLAAGECRIAIAAGVNVMATPDLTVYLSKLRALSPDGRCRAFDESASGYGRGEGCAAVVLLRLPDALEERGHVRAVLLGSAVGHGGRASGLTAPCGPAQEAVVRKALAAARVEPGEVDYVEAHGTGTPLGDPIEIGALRGVFGPGRERGRPLVVGSVKTNLGHLEAAAGVAGLVKVVLSLEHEALPAHLHFRRWNSHVAQDGLPLRIPETLQPWKRGDRRRVAGVSSFGIGGTNAHLVVAEGPGPVPRRGEPPRPVQILPLSARSPEALRELARRVRASFDPSLPVEAADLCYSASTGRSGFEHRIALVGETPAELRAGLDAFLEGAPAPALHRGRAVSGGPRIAFLFTGQGSQYAGMARGVWDREPVFRRELERLGEALGDRLGRPLPGLLLDEDPSTRELLDRTEYTQPALYALETSLAELWRSWGIEPAAVLGHSVGEFPAAVAAGVLDPLDGLSLIAERGRRMGRLPPGGAMACVLAPAARVLEETSSLGGTLSIAAYNGPANVVVAGLEGEVEALVAGLGREGVRSVRLDVSCAFHSPLVEPALDGIERAAEGIRHGDPRIPLVSNLTGRPVGPGEVGPGHWRRHAREPVRFAAGMEALAAAGCDVFLEIGPRPTLVELGRRALGEDGRTWLPSLARGRDPCRTLLSSLAELWVRGAAVDWDGFHRGRAVRRAPLPTYPFQRERFWLEGPRADSRPPADAGEAVETVLSVATSPWLADHRFRGRILVPAAAFWEMALRAAERFGARALEGVAIAEPLYLAGDGGARVRIELSRAGETCPFRATSEGPDGKTRVHASGMAVSGREDLRSVPRIDEGSWPEEIPVEEHYRALAARGLDYGPSFRRIRRLRRAGEVALAEVDPAPDTEEGRVHPATLDACLQPLGALLDPDSTEAYLPIGADRVEVFHGSPGPLLCRASIRERGPGTIVADSTLEDPAGGVRVRIEGARFRRALREEWLHQVEWRRVDSRPPAGRAEGNWLLVADHSGVAAALAARLERLGARAVLAAPGDSRRLLDPPGGPWRGALHLASIGAGPESLRGGHAWDALELARSFADSGARTGRLWIVTAGAEAVGEADRARVSPFQAISSGLARTLAAEYPDLAVATLDMDPRALEVPGGLERAVDRLAAEIVAEDQEDRIALRGADRFVSRLVRRAFDPGPRRLVRGENGTLEGLHLVGVARPRPGPGEVAVRVRRAGLNFRDVLAALGLYPGDPGPLGGECAGEILAVGEGVEDFSRGDPVVALAPGAFASEIAVPASLVVPVPPGISGEDAATVPVAFLTARWALERVGRMAPGETVLVHSAAGGVGRAAVQLARSAGLTVLATAGSDARRELVRSMGVRHVFDSRSDSFAEGVLAATGGRGVDLVLSALAGDLVRAGLSVVAPGGRFLEIGKIGGRDAERVAAGFPGVAYHRIALDDVAREDPAALGRMLAELVADLAAGRILPLPRRTFPIEDATSAFRLMQRSEHPGKVVLSFSGPDRPRRITSEASYLVTGGAGALGLLVARWLAERGAGRIVLAGRSEPGDSARARIEALGGSVRFVRADVTDLARVSDLVSEIRASGFPLAGVVHAAGVLADALAADLTREDFDRTLGPKVAGAWNLHLATRDDRLDLFVLFSSAASILGNAGQAAYAAGNAFLDGLAEHRRGIGLPAISIEWGPWAGEGMAARAGQAARWNARGIESIEPAEGLAILERILRDDPVRIAVLPVRWDLWLSRLHGAPAPFLREVAPAPLVPPPGAVRGEDRGIDSLLDLVRRRAAEVLGLPAGAVLDLDESLFARGLDSLMAVELRNALSGDAGKPLPATLLFDAPTPRVLAERLARETGAAPMPARSAPKRRVPREDRSPEPVAVVGMGCRFPGGAEDPGSFWTLLIQGRDGVREVPADRWEVDRYYDPDPDAPGKAYVRCGGFLAGPVDRFDAPFFGVSPREAARMDPQQRLLLEVAWEALEEGAQAPDRLAGARAGVFIGLSTSDYLDVLKRAAGLSGIDAHWGSGNMASVAAGRLSHFLGLRGPCFPIDTACSSSLVAVHLAVESLHQGECDLALAGGVNLMLAPESMVAMAKLRALSPSGRCRTFDAGADGYARGEGAGIVVLRRLSDALADRDPIHALILGSAVNHDGRGARLMAPSGCAQEEVVAAALERAGIEPAAVGYVEAHGTGTSLGDPIELHALAAVLGRARSPERPLAVGSVKTNIGHLEAAAGIAGLVKAVLAIEKERIPPHLHFRELNPHVSIGAFPLRIPVEPTPWTPGERRIAGVSSFGIGGTNAHVILAPAPRVEETEADSTERALVLSARSEGALRELARRHARRLEERPHESFSDVARTAFLGRAHLSHRAAVLARDVRGAAAGLAALAEGRPAAGLLIGREDPDRAGEGALGGALRRWLGGESVEWRELDPSDRGRKTRLPTYPFERERHWFDGAESSPATVPPSEVGVPFPEPAPLAAPPPEAPPEARLAHLTDYLRGRVAAVLETPSERVGPAANLVDLGLDSLLAIQLARRVGRELGVGLRPREIYERPTVESLARFLLRELEGSRLSAPDRAVPERVPGVALVLSAPRSGSTLLRVMLAGHPEIFSPPELHLLPYADLALRRAAIAPDALDEGLVRAWMEIAGVGTPEAGAWIAELEARRTPVAEVYRLLREKSGRRILVDKSPSYAASRETLDRAERLFDGARYVHLVRDPRAAVESFARLRLDRLLEPGDADPHAAGEEAWGRAQRNILEFLRTVDRERAFLVRYEDLVTEPERVMRELLSFLGVGFHEAVLRPYEGARMTDGLGGGAPSVGDPRFLEHDRIDDSLARRGEEARLPRPLGSETGLLARELGYEIGEIRKSPEAEPRETMVHAPGRSLCVVSWGNLQEASVLCLHGLLEQALVWEPVARRLIERGPVVAALDLAGHGKSDPLPEGASYHLLDFVAGADRALAELTRPAVVVGHSLGAAVAALLATARPERVRALVLVEPAAERGSGAAETIRALLDALARRPEHPALADLGAAAERLVLATPALDPEFARRLARRGTFEGPGGLVWRHDPRLTLRAGLAFGLPARELARSLETLRIPIRLVFARGSLEAGGEPWRGWDPPGGLVQRIELPGGHALHVERPEEIAGAILEALRASGGRGGAG